VSLLAECDKEAGACDQLEKEYAFVTNKMPRSAELQHKYILDVYVLRPQ
jgi:hypothetical protein